MEKAFQNGRIVYKYGKRGFKLHEIKKIYFTVSEVANKINIHERAIRFLVDFFLTVKTNRFGNPILTQANIHFLKILVQNRRMIKNLTSYEDDFSDLEKLVELQ